MSSPCTLSVSGLITGGQHVHSQISYCAQSQYFAGSLRRVLFSLVMQLLAKSLSDKRSVARPTKRNVVTHLIKYATQRLL